MTQNSFNPISWIRQQIPQLAKFGSVGATAFIIDLAFFNLFLLVFHFPSIPSKILSVFIATIWAWLGNRLWTFSGQKTESRRKEFTQFALINLIGMVIGLIPLWISHYVLGFTSPLADNIAANVIGLGLGTIFRFFAYRSWVFTGASAKDSTPEAIDAIPNGHGGYLRAPDTTRNSV